MGANPRSRPGGELGSQRFHRIVSRDLLWMHSRVFGLLLQGRAAIFKLEQLGLGIRHGFLSICRSRIVSGSHCSPQISLQDVGFALQRVNCAGHKLQIAFIHLPTGFIRSPRSCISPPFGFNSRQTLFFKAFFQRFDAVFRRNFGWRRFFRLFNLDFRLFCSFFYCIKVDFDLFFSF